MAMNNSLAEVHFLKTHPVYEHWYPVFAVMIGTGLRVGEVTGLRWCDIDMENEKIIKYLTEKREIEKNWWKSGLTEVIFTRKRSIIMLYLSAEMQMVFQDMHTAGELVK